MKIEQTQKFDGATCAFCDGVTRQHIAVLDNIANSVKAFR